MSREYRMYGMVPYQLMGIQQGIQFGHAVVEYALNYGDADEYKTWAKYHKTFIILNGGTTNTKYGDDGLPTGTLNKTAIDLYQDYGVHKIGFFREPDLQDALTAICFLVDERVWNIEKYPDPNDGEYTDDVYEELVNRFDGEIIQCMALRNYLRGFRLA